VERGEHDVGDRAGVVGADMRSLLRTEQHSDLTGSYVSVTMEALSVRLA
jgi:hypothetical protein